MTKRSESYTRHFEMGGIFFPFYPPGASMNLSTLEKKVSWNSLGMLTRKIIIVNLTVSLILNLNLNLDFTCENGHSILSR